MNTNHNGHALRNLTNRVMAVIDDERNAQAAVETLERSGIAERDLAKHMDIALNDGRGAFVSGDAGLLTTLFRNVIESAIRYSAPGSKVDVDVAATASEVRVTVSDRAPAFHPRNARTSSSDARLSRPDRGRSLAASEASVTNRGESRGGA